MLIAILIDVQYLQNDVLSGQLHSSLDAHHLLKKIYFLKFPIPPPLGGGRIFSTHPLTLVGKPWSVTSRVFFALRLITHQVVTR